MLIAAAPDLLEACKKALESVDDNMAGEGLTDRGLTNLLRMVIAKAEGVP